MPSSSALKRISFISIALVLFLFSFEGVSTYASPPEEKLPKEDNRPLATGSYVIYLPFLTDDHCFPCDSIPSPFSISIADLFNADFSDQVQALKDSGASWTRIQLDWKSIEPSEDQPYIWTFYDNKLGAVTAAGVRPIVIVDGVPAWAGSSSCPPISFDQLDELSEFLTDLVNRYKQPPYLIQHWEIINEPDATSSSSLGSNCWGNVGSDYAEMLAAAYPAIKAADPQATVLMGGIAYDAFTEYSGPFNRYFPDDVMSNGGSAYLDLLNFHYFPDFHAEWERWNTNTPTCGYVEDSVDLPYSGSGVDVIAKFNHLRNRMQTCFGVNKPIWITELAEHGYVNNPNVPDSLARQSRYVIQGYARGLAAGAQNITWYALKIAPDDLVNYPNEQGLLYDNLSPKPAFTTYQTMTSELKGYQYNRTLSVSGGGEAYVFRSPYPKEKTVAWSNSSGTLTFAPATQLRIVSRLGVVTFIQDGDAGDTNGNPNAVGLQLTVDPVFIQVVS